MNKVYVLTDVYVDLEYRGLESCNIDIFGTKEKALKELKDRVMYDLNYEDSSWVIDAETPIDNLDSNMTIRLFWKCQENWDKYYEVEVNESEIK